MGYYFYPLISIADVYSIFLFLDFYNFNLKIQYI
jgi:hypothetical protein